MHNEAMRTCPTGAIKAILDLAPVHLVIESIAKKTHIQNDQGRNN